MSYRYTRSDGTEGRVDTIEALEAELRARLIEPDTVVLDEAANVRAKAAALIVFAKKRAASQPSAPRSPYAPPASAAKATDDDATQGLNKHRMLALLAAFVGYMVAGGMSNLLPYYLGYVTPYVIAGTLVIIGISNFFVKRETMRQRARQWYAGAGVFFVLMIVVTVVAPALLKKGRDESERAAIQAIAKTGRESARQIEELDKGGKPVVSARAPVAADSRSALGRATPHVQAMQAEFVKIYADLKAYEDRNGVDTILDKASFTTREGREKNRVVLSAYVGELEKYEQTRLAVQTKYRDRVAEAIGSGEGAKQFMDGFDKALKRNTDMQGESVANHREMLKAIEELNGFMDTTRPPPAYRNGRHEFVEQAQLDRFKGLMGSIGTIGAKEEALMERRAKIMKESVEKLDRAAAEAKK